MGIIAVLDHKALRRFAGFEVAGGHSPRIGAGFQPIDHLAKVKAIEAEEVLMAAEAFYARSRGAFLPQ